MSNDLFGQPIVEPVPLPPGAKVKRKTTPKGYAAPPGSGPVNETCKTCDHYRRVHYHDKTYRKCALRKPWTHGPGTDIKASSPACSRWVKPAA